MRTRFRGLAAFAGIVTLISIGGCTEAPPSPQTIAWTGATGGGRLLLAGSGTVLYAVWGDRQASLAGPSASAVATPVPGPSAISDSPTAASVSSLTLDTMGTPWLVRHEMGATTWAGVWHPAAAEVRALGTGTVTATDGRVVTDRLVSDEGVAVVDDTTMLAPTFTGVRRADNDANVILERVTASGATPEAGRWRGQAPAPLSRLSVGESVPATALDLGVIRAVSPLSSSRVALVVGDSSASSNAPSGRLTLAVVEAGMVRRAPLPDLCPAAGDVSLQRISDHRLLLGAPAPASNGDCVARGFARTWALVDVTAGTVTVVATDAEAAAVVGDRLVTARTAQAFGLWTTTLHWQPLAG